MDDIETVRTMLGAAGVHPPEDDCKRLARLYPKLRRQMEEIYAVDTGDEVQAAVYRAGEWS